MTRFSDRVAIVTGAGQGMGLAIAGRLLSEGASVVLADINPDRLASAADELTQWRSTLERVEVDITRASDVTRLVARAQARFGAVDILVNNAGVLRSSAIEQISEEEWDLVVNANLKASFLCAQAVVPDMKVRRYGKVLNMASMAGRATSTLGGAHYTAAKAGVLGLTRHLARELAPYRINVNAVSPGIVDTPMVAAALTPEQRQKLAASIPFERLATPHEIASLVAFLVSDEAAYITGASVDIHGGELIIA
ncbi:MAG TPA: SDR family NAD(P)-dependent oxidoreductase [Chloroflexota bacterium]|jgi:NAD(P)-dependent dehydrogenase (short-subunit alcohol dehydrogenase family)